MRLGRFGRSAVRPSGGPERSPDASYPAEPGDLCPTLGKREHRVPLDSRAETGHRFRTSGRIVNSLYLSWKARRANERAARDRGQVDLG